MQPLNLRLKDKQGHLVKVLAVEGDMVRLVQNANCVQYDGKWYFFAGGISNWQEAEMLNLDIGFKVEEVS